MTPNFNANPLASLLAGTLAPAAGADSNPLMVAQPAAGGDAADDNADNFLAVLQLLSVSGVEADTLADVAPAVAPSALALPAPLTPGEAPGIPVMQASLDALEEGSAMLLAGSGIGVPEGGSPLPQNPLDVAPVSMAVVQSTAPASPAAPINAAPAPAPARPELPARTPTLPSFTHGEAAVASARPPTDGATGLLRAAAATPRQELPPPLATDVLRAPETPRPPLGDAVRELLRLQTGPAAVDGRNGRTISNIATAVDPLPDLRGPDGYLPDATRIATQSADRLAGAPSLAPALPLARPAGMPGWDQALGQRVLWMAESGLGQAELRLDPPHLGNLSVRIAMNDDQAQVFFQAQHPAARDALESALPRLREMFAEQGLELGNADVNSGEGGHAEPGHADLADAGSDGQAAFGERGDGPESAAAPGASESEQRARRMSLIDTYA